MIPSSIEWRPLIESCDKIKENWWWWHKFNLAKAQSEKIRDSNANRWAQSCVLLYRYLQQQFSVQHCRQLNSSARQLLFDYESHCSTRIRTTLPAAPPKSHRLRCWSPHRAKPWYCEWRSRDWRSNYSLNCYYYCQYYLCLCGCCWRDLDWIVHGDGVTEKICYSTYDWLLSLNYNYWL